MSEWAFLTNHANVLICVTEEPDIRLRDLAAKIDISERAVKRIVADLERRGRMLGDEVAKRILHAEIFIRTDDQAAKSFASVTSHRESLARSTAIGLRSTP